MKKINFYCIVISLLLVFFSCDKDDKQENDNGLKFSNVKLEKLIRENLNKPNEAIFQEDLLKITTLNAGTNLSSLSEVELLKNLTFLNIVDNKEIKDKDVADLKIKLNKCEVLHRCYILNNQKYYILRNINIKKTELSNYPENEFQINLLSDDEKTSARLTIFLKSESILEAKNTSAFIANQNHENHTYHDYWSYIKIKDIYDELILKENNTTEVKVFVTNENALTISIIGDNKVSYHTDNYTE